MTSDRASQSLEMYAVSFLAQMFPFLLRKVDGAPHYKLVGEAYIHNLLRGEAIDMLREDELQEEEFILC